MKHDETSPINGILKDTFSSGIFLLRSLFPEGLRQNQETGSKHKFQRRGIVWGCWNKCQWNWSLTSCSIRLSPACHHYDMSGHTKGCKRLNQQETALPWSKSWGVGKGCGGRRMEKGYWKRERIVFCWFNSPKWLIRRSEESQGTHSGGSGTVGPDHRNQGSKGLLLHCLTVRKAVGELQWSSICP